MLRPWLELARISNLPTVWTNVTAAWVLAGGSLDDFRWLWLLLAGSLLYTAGMILNDAADTSFDRQHRTERPIPRGLVTETNAWSVGLGMLLTGGWIAWRLAAAHPILIGALMGAILFYNLYHKPWPGAVWVMGSCRTFLYLMTASAFIWERLANDAYASDPSVRIATNTISYLNWSDLSAALTLGAYVVGLTMVARQESKGPGASVAGLIAAKILLYTPVLLAASWMINAAQADQLDLFGKNTPLAPAALITLFIALVLHATRLMKQGGPAIGQAVSILLAGIVVVDALAIVRISLPLALVFVALWPLLRLWQRKIAAT